MKPAGLTPYHAWIMNLAMLAAISSSACLREVPGTTCTQQSDCYVGEQCIAQVCTPQASQEDMREDLLEARDMPDMTPDASPDQSMPTDMPADLMVVDTPADTATDLPDLLDMPVDGMDTPPDEDMPEIPPLDMPTDMTVVVKEGLIIPGARLPGQRASRIVSGMTMPLVLAYVEDEQNGTLKLYRFDDVQGWTANDVADNLNWPTSDLTENAALLGRETLRVLYEVHQPGNTGISLRSAQVNTATGSVSSDEQIIPIQAHTTLSFDYRETIAGPSALIVLSDRIERFSRQAGGSWTLAATYPGAFTSARFVVDTQHMCGLTTTSTLSCYTEVDTSTPVIEEAMVERFETLWLPDIAPTRHQEFVMFLRGDRFVYEEMENRQTGPPPGRGLQWRQTLNQSTLPPGDRLSIASSPRLVSYRQRNGDVVYSTNASMPNATATPVTYSNPVTASCGLDQMIYIFGSPEPGNAMPGISYESHTSLP